MSPLTQDASLCFEVSVKLHSNPPFPSKAKLIICHEIHTPAFILDAYRPKGMFPDSGKCHLSQRLQFRKQHPSRRCCWSPLSCVWSFVKVTVWSAFWRLTRNCSLGDRSSPYLQFHHRILTHFVSSCLRNIIYANQFSLVFYTVTFESSQEGFICFFWPWRWRKGLVGLFVFWRYFYIWVSWDFFVWFIVFCLIWGFLL